MKIQSEIITKFLEGLPQKCKKPIDKMITKMLESSKYIDGSTLIYDENNEYEFDKDHYHNWDCNPVKIEQIKNIKNNEYNEINDIELTDLLGKYSSPNIECVKGDVQLGKRVHACIMMWMSIYIYERPVLYLFRPLNIDKEQLQDDIEGTAPWNFNMEWIKDKFNKSKDFDESSTKYTEYELPPLTDIKLKNIANKLSDKITISKHKKIYMALMNPTDLDTLNKKFYEYILEYCEKVNITLIIDESDLLSPTAENISNVSNKDTKNSKSERLISRLVNKVAHTIHITGTAHSFFWNYTTALSDNNKTIIPVEKIFVMNRHNDYYGFMKKNINFSTNNQKLPTISEWWSKGRGVSKEDKYDVIKDYNLNIKNIIGSIVKRQNQYNSFLISEEKIQGNQIKLAEKIITDFNLFCVVFHGKKGKNGLPTGLRLYFPKKIDNLDIEQELYQVVISEKRLDKLGGLKGTPTSDIDEDYNDNYKYYDIDMKSKEFNIKMIYKVLAKLFKKIKSNKTIITITGKYGERGYSFTSDYYDDDNKYVLHLTDQYFVSHTSYNCTDIFQRGRIQGKYTDNPNLIFWTTTELVELINDYVNNMLIIENKIMSLPRGNEHIRNCCVLNLCGNRKLFNALGRPNQRKNLKKINIKYDRKNKAMIYSFPPKLKPEEYEEYFSNWCKEQGIEFNGFINRLETQDKKDYLEMNHKYEIEIPKRIKKSSISEQIINNRSLLKDFIIKNFSKFKNYTLDRIINVKKENTNGDRYKGIEEAIDNNNSYNYTRKADKLCYNIIIHENYPNIHVTSISNKKILPKSDLNILQKQNYKKISNNEILYSQLNYKYINDNFLDFEFEDDYELKDNDKFKLDKKDITLINDNSYFFLTADGYVYHHDPEKSIKKIRIKIKSEIEQTRNSELINPILTFKEDCIKEIKGSKRVGVKKVIEVYNLWCKKNGFKEYKKLKDFRENFEKITGLERSKTNIRGYKIELKI